MQVPARFPRERAIFRSKKCQHPDNPVPILNSIGTFITGRFETEGPHQVRLGLKRCLDASHSDRTACEIGRNMDFVSRQLSECDASRVSFAETQFLSREWVRLRNKP